ncbi:MAG: TMF family protein, partial [Deltaproteobacteria bacterium]|nr:TMF family protein [Deltaproteobacteria bacterium]
MLFHSSHQNETIGPLRENMTELEKQLAEAQKKCEALTAEVDAKEKRIDDLLKSLSWRITAPLRFAVSVAEVILRLAKGFSDPVKYADAGRDAEDTADIIYAVLNQLIRNPLPAEGFESRSDDAGDAALPVLQDDRTERRPWSIAMVTRGDIFPANHGGAVKIERTAYGLSFLVENVFLITDEFSRYYVFRDGRVETRFFPRKTRLAGLHSMGWKRKLGELGVPEGTAFLYRPFFDKGFLSRLSYVASKHNIGLFQAEFPAYARPCIEAQKPF